MTRRKRPPSHESTAPATQVVQTPAEASAPATGLAARLTADDYRQLADDAIHLYEVDRRNKARAAAAVAGGKS